MKKYALALWAAAVLSGPLSANAAFDECREHFPNKSIPKVEARAKTRALCFDSFAILHSGESKTPVYVVERLNRARLLDAKGEKRTDRFYEEARLPAAERALLSDYTKSGYHKGHMAPAADMPNPNAMAQSFSLSNMVPQAPKHNTGIWGKKVESDTRKYAERAEGDVFVFTGPAYKGQVEKIGAGRVWVPTHIFKLVYDQKANRAWAYWTENKDTAKLGKPISYQELVELIGIELLPGINPRK